MLWRTRAAQAGQQVGLVVDGKALGELLRGYNPQTDSGVARLAPPLVLQRQRPPPAATPATRPPARAPPSQNPSRAAPGAAASAGATLTALLRMKVALMIMRRVSPLVASTPPLLE